MSDKFFDINQEGGTNRNPITNAGRVAGNFLVDQEEYETRKTERMSAWPKSSLDDKVFKVIPRDLCFYNKSKGGWRTGNLSTGSQAVFSVFNGANPGTMTHHEYIDSLALACLAGGDGANFDTNGREARHQGFAGILGGLQTIVNNGPVRITNGELLYWDVPAYGDETTERARRDSSRILAITRPYNPKKDKACARAVKSAIRNPRSNRSDSNTPCHQAAKVVKDVACQMAVNAFDALLSSGLVVYDPVALGVDATAANRRAQNAAAWVGLDKPTREQHILRVARGLGCRKVRDPANNSNVSSHGLAARGMSLRGHLISLLSGDTNLVATDANTGSVPPGDLGEVSRNQHAALADLFGGVEAANFHVKRRVFAKALTPASPGQEFDIILGHYMI